jgi:hypothetical protein
MRADRYKRGANGFAPPRYPPAFSGSISQRSGEQPIVVKEEFGKKEPEQLLQLTIARAFDLIESCVAGSRAS